MPEHDPGAEANGANGNGRDARGRFVQGTPGGPGNPIAARAAGLRAALLAAVEPEDIEAAVRALVEKARGGDLVAIRELLDRTTGKAPAVVEAVLPARVVNLDFSFLPDERLIQLTEILELIEAHEALEEAEAFADGTDELPRIVQETDLRAPRAPTAPRGGRSNPR